MGWNMTTNPVVSLVRGREDTCLDQQPSEVKIVCQFTRTTKVADKQSPVLRPVPHPQLSQRHTPYDPRSPSGPIRKCLVLEGSHLPSS
jgi:hypothetical protein